MSVKDSLNNARNNKIIQEVVPGAAGTVVGLGAPPVAILAGGSLTGLAGGAAIMKTAAVVGSVVGGGAAIGVALIGAASVGLGIATYFGVKKLMKI